MAIKIYIKHDKILMYPYTFFRNGIYRTSYIPTSEDLHSIYICMLLCRTLIVRDALVSFYAQGI